MWQWMCLYRAQAHYLKLVLAQLKETFWHFFCTFYLYSNELKVSALYIPMNIKSLMVFLFNLLQDLSLPFWKASGEKCKSHHDSLLLTICKQIVFKIKIQALTWKDGSVTLCITVITFTLWMYTAGEWIWTNYDVPSDLKSCGLLNILHALVRSEVNEVLVKSWKSLLDSHITSLEMARDPPSSL